MKRAILAALLLPLGAACDSESAASPTPQESKAHEFTRAMKSIDSEYEKLQADLTAGNPPEAAKSRVAAIRATAEKASRLNYRESEAENRELAFEFRTFLEASGKLEGASWSGQDGQRAWRKLGTACAACHQIYRKEKER